MLAGTRSHACGHDHSHGGTCSQGHDDHGHSHGSSSAHGHSHSHGSILDEALHGEALEMCKRATLVGAATNAFLCLSKLMLGTAGNSVALVADGLHALVDLISDAVSYAAVALSTKKFPRCQFPFGVGRLETIGSTIVAAILLFGGVSLLWSAIGRIFDAFYPHNSTSQINEHGTNDHRHGVSCDGAHDEAAEGHHGHSHGLGHSHVELTAIDAATGQQLIVWSMVAVCALSVVGKELLFRWTKRVGERAGSRVVVANAYHHRADAWSAGVALVGVGGISIGLPLSDAVAGTVVAMSICSIGWTLLQRSVLELFDYQQADTVDGLNAAVSGVTQRMPIINVFGTRHGHAFILHATLVVGPETSAARCVAMRDELRRSAAKVLRISEVFLSLLVVDKKDPETLKRALNEVVSFHCAGQMAHEPVVDWFTMVVYIDDEYVVKSSSGGKVKIQDCCRQDIAVVVASCGLTVQPLSMLSDVPKSDTTQPAPGAS